MSTSLESIFVSEFRNEVANIGYKDIYSIPLPSECANWYVSGTELYAVNGIESQYYSKLNKTIVRRVPRGYTIKRRVIDKVSRSYKRNEEGNFIYESFPQSNGSVAVISKAVISLPYSEYKKKLSKDGYGYIDFIKNKDGGAEYIYVLPKSVLYKVNQTALVLSVKNMKNYAGCGYMTWDSGMIFLHVIPYNPNISYSGTRILKTGYSLDYNSDIQKIIEYWQKINIIPNLALCYLNDGSNLALKGTSVGYSEYNPVELLALCDKQIYGSDK